MRKQIVRVGLVCAALSALFGALTASGAAGASTHDGRQDVDSVVFVQTNQPDANQIVVYDRGDDGVLSRAGTYDTGGQGGSAVGAVSDRLASQGSLVYDPRHALLFAVNAGSDTLSVFRVRGDRLTLEQVIPSGGAFPASVAVHDGLIFVLNAGGTGVLQGFRITGHSVQPLSGSTRPVGLANTDPPGFLTSPGQIGFTPDGHQLVVTTKASTSEIVIFAVAANGSLSSVPVRNASATPVPFAFAFDDAQRLVVGEAGASAVTTYSLAGNGSLSNPQSLSDNQVALCWITRVRGYYYVSNTGSNTVSGYRLDAGGKPTLVTTNGIVATTAAGTIDSAAADDAFLYVQTGIAGTVDEFRVNDDGTLTRIGTVTGLPPGMEGIAAT